LCQCRAGRDNAGTHSSSRRLPSRLPSLGEAPPRQAARREARLAELAACMRVASAHAGYKIAWFVRSRHAHHLCRAISYDARRGHGSASGGKIGSIVVAGSRIAGPEYI
jgi:hypothetical protein